MKKLILIVTLAFGTHLVSAQAPEKMSYQAVVRSTTGQLIQNQNVGLKVSILQNSGTGTVVYSERLMGTTNANGLVSLAIGSGTVLSGIFSSIDWSTGNYHLKTETDPTGGTNYTIAGTSQLLSVPYAMYAKTSGNGTGSSGWSLMGNTVTETDFIGTTNNKPLKFKMNGQNSGIISSDNTSFGFGSFNGSGTNNSAFGKETLSVNDSGTSNTAVGEYALRYNKTGSYNAVTGRGAMYTNISGSDNVATGFGTLFYNESGTDNVATGSRALFSNTIGNYNIATGSNALQSNTGGSNNIAMGTNALYANKTGIQNIAIGANSLTANIAGNYNVATGTEALQNNKGTANVATGHQALTLNSNGFGNVANGAYAMIANTDGSGNMAAGYEAMKSNTEGNYNVANGYQALLQNTTGTENVAIGNQSLKTNTTGDRNTSIGSYANVISGNLSNSTAIGYDALVTVSNKVRLGNSSVTVIEGQVPFSNVSDERFKYDIKNNVPGLDFIKKLKPVTYFMDTEKMESFLKTGTLSNSKAITSANKQMSTGFLAQEVAKAAQELGYSFDGVHAPTNEKDYYSVAYSQFVMPLVKAVQEQQVMLETLEKRIEELEKK